MATGAKVVPGDGIDVPGHFELNVQAMRAPGNVSRHHQCRTRRMWNE